MALDKRGICSQNSRRQFILTGETSVYPNEVAAQTSGSLVSGLVYWPLATCSLKDHLPLWSQREGLEARRTGGQV